MSRDQDLTELNPGNVNSKTNRSRSKCTVKQQRRQAVSDVFSVFEACSSKIDQNKERQEHAWRIQSSGDVLDKSKTKSRYKDRKGKILGGIRETLSQVNMPPIWPLPWVLQYQTTGSLYSGGILSNNTSTEQDNPDFQKIGEMKLSGGKSKIWFLKGVWDSERGLWRETRVQSKSQFRKSGERELQVCTLQMLRP
ncbi:hypothetical protein H6P81_013432 [Aristolochia fimbriata]|uniref:Uncharacterized protein n=1 Tax=Aristolochia fimbriata TaxID=158543 RepID=A0AAV7EF40_ARIFI|nr:hypothetical protein H6P81_013432 [Aristolochia fimbriata]